MSAMVSSPGNFPKGAMVPGRGHTDSDKRRTPRESLYIPENISQQESINESVIDEKGRQG